MNSPQSESDVRLRGQNQASSQHCSFVGLHLSAQADVALALRRIHSLKINKRINSPQHESDVRLRGQNQASSQHCSFVGLHLSAQADVALALRRIYSLAASFAYNQGMGKPYTQIYLHLVWATWDRLPLITSAIEPRLYGCLRQEATELGCEMLALNGIDDHVHLLMQTPPTRCASEIVKQLKGSSSHMIATCIAPQDGFKWQGYYGAFSVSRSDLKRVQSYIDNQKNVTATKICGWKPRKCCGKTAHANKFAVRQRIYSSASE